jgi:hypothetical protein
MFMRAVVVRHQMQLEVRGKVLVQVVQKAQELPEAPPGLSPAVDDGEQWQARHT